MCRHLRGLNWASGHFLIPPQLSLPLNMLWLLSVCLSLAFSLSPSVSVCLSSSLCHFVLTLYPIYCMNSRKFHRQGNTMWNNTFPPTASFWVVFYSLLYLIKLSSLWAHLVCSFCCLFSLKVFQLWFVFCVSFCSQAYAMINTPWNWLLIYSVLLSLVHFHCHFFFNLSETSTIGQVQMSL